MQKKTFLLFSTLLTLFFISSCSVLEKNENKTGEIYEQNLVTKKAEFEGGKNQLAKFLSTNLEYPSDAIQNKIQGKVIVKFIVETNGTIGSFETVKDIGASCGDEVIRVLQKTQSRWNSAKINTKRVRSSYVLNIIFKIPSDNSKPYIQGDTL